jgi:hypothetical protein
MRAVLIIFLLAVDVAAAQRIQLRTSTGPNAEIAARLERYRPGVTPVQPITRQELSDGAPDFKRGATAWIEAAVDPVAQPRRRLIVATYVLDLVREWPRVTTTTQSRTGSVPASPGAQLIEWACSTLRKSAPLQSEVAWHIAAMALLERDSLRAYLAAHLEHAEARFPSEAHWLLIHTLLDELESAAGRRDDGTLSISGGLASKAAAHFEAAAARPATRQMALIRWAAFESDLGHQDVALNRLAAVGRLESDVLRYWAGMIRGRALERAGRGSEAIDAYRAVVVEFPHAQSAGLSLAAALVGANRVAEAARLVSVTIAFPTGAEGPDPWDFYRAPETLLWSAAFDAIRREVTP